MATLAVFFFLIPFPSLIVRRRRHVACSRRSNAKFIMTRLAPCMYPAGIRPNAGGAGPHSNVGHVCAAIQSDSYLA
ncbi:hypothetical protein DFH29DRAFT_892074 [Suillus ampliporus]|nr:hypothetical protein DFH29DRAFT_892074 [Suillus ampliporus]